MTDQSSIASPRASPHRWLPILDHHRGGRLRLYHALTLIVWNDATATAGNILASEHLWRLSSAAMLVMLACDVAVAAIFYVLFKPVNRTLSLIAFAFRIVLVAITGVALLGRHAPLLLLKDAAASAFETDQLQAMAILSGKTPSSQRAPCWSAALSTSQPWLCSPR